MASPNSSILPLRGETRSSVLEEDQSSGAFDQEKEDELIFAMLSGGEKKEQHQKREEEEEEDGGAPPQSSTGTTNEEQPPQIPIPSTTAATTFTTNTSCSSEEEKDVNSDNNSCGGESIPGYLIKEFGFFRGVAWEVGGGYGEFAADWDEEGNAPLTGAAWMNRSTIRLMGCWKPAADILLSLMKHFDFNVKLAFALCKGVCYQLPKRSYGLQPLKAASVDTAGVHHRNHLNINLLGSDDAVLDIVQEEPSTPSRREMVLTLLDYSENCFEIPAKYGEAFHPNRASDLRLRRGKAGAADQGPFRGYGDFCLDIAIESSRVGILDQLHLSLAVLEHEQTHGIVDVKPPVHRTRRFALAKCLQLAAANGHLNVAKYLLRRGEESSAPPSRYPAVDQKNFIPFPDPEALLKNHKLFVDVNFRIGKDHPFWIDSRLLDQNIYRAVFPHDDERRSTPLSKTESYELVGLASVSCRSLLQWAIKGGNIDLVEEILPLYSSAAAGNHHNSAGSSATAGTDGDVRNSLKNYIERRFSKLGLRFNSGEIDVCPEDFDAIGYAARYSHLNMVRFLFEKSGYFDLPEVQKWFLADEQNFATLKGLVTDADTRGNHAKVQYLSKWIEKYKKRLCPEEEEEDRTSGTRMVYDDERGDDEDDMPRGISTVGSAYDDGFWS